MMLKYDSNTEYVLIHSPAQFEEKSNVESNLCLFSSIAGYLILNALYTKKHDSENQFYTNIFKKIDPNFDLEKHDKDFDKAVGSLAVALRNYYFENLSEAKETLESLEVLFNNKKEHPDKFPNATEEKTAADYFKSQEKNKNNAHYGDENAAILNELLFKGVIHIDLTGTIKLDAQQNCISLKNTEENKKGEHWNLLIPKEIYEEARESFTTELRRIDETIYKPVGSPAIATVNETKKEEERKPATKKVEENVAPKITDSTSAAPSNVTAKSPELVAENGTEVNRWNDDKLKKYCEKHKDSVTCTPNKNAITNQQSYIVEYTKEHIKLGVESTEVKLLTANDDTKNKEIIVEKALELIIALHCRQGDDAKVLISPKAFNKELTDALTKCLQKEAFSKKIELHSEKAKTPASDSNVIPRNSPTNNI